MRGFVIETYQPSPHRGELEGRAQRLVAAAAELSSEGDQVRFLRTLFLPGDEICFYFCEAESAEAVKEAARRAGYDLERVAEASELSVELG